MRPDDTVYQELAKRGWEWVQTSAESWEWQKFDEYGEPAAQSDFNETLLKVLEELQ